MSEHDLPIRDPRAKPIWDELEAELEDPVLEFPAPSIPRVRKVRIPTQGIPAACFVTMVAVAAVVLMSWREGASTAAYAAVTTISSAFFLYLHAQRNKGSPPEAQPNGDAKGPGATGAHPA